MIFERLQKEFEAARAAQSEEISLDGEQWNDGLLATIRERVHMEADRKAISSQTSTPLDPPIHAKITYKIKNKVFLYIGYHVLLLAKVYFDSFSFQYCYTILIAVTKPGYDIVCC
ncbi:hypothetical protein B296_00043180 [Ensete ventricosum]|uniref:Uncharacterized protein n=1 Tax=Ensete ventricosum TaxID=4639 RepID=A0A426ZFQ6_ENSVE|nr:hypothetical protein B296_00043180 [Ensete ventricosum]